MVNEKARLSTTVDKDIMEKIEDIATIQGRKPYDIVREALYKFVKEYEEQ